MVTGPFQLALESSFPSISMAVLGAALSVLVMGCTRSTASSPSQPDSKSVESPPTVEPTTPASVEAPDRPVPRTIEQPWMSLEEWRSRHQSQLTAAGRDDAALALVGDSITQMWADTEAYREFLPYRPLNLGIGGDQTQHVLWRLDHGSLRGASPKVVVVLIGVNNLGNGHSPEETVRGILAVVDSVHHEVPAAKVLLLGVLPSGAKPTDPMREKVAQTNRLLAATRLPPAVTYADIGAPLVEADGEILPTTMADGLHPTPQGFLVLTRALLPQLQALGL